MPSLLRRLVCFCQQVLACLRLRWVLLMTRLPRLPGGGLRSCLSNVTTTSIKQSRILYTSNLLSAFPRSSYGACMEFNRRGGPGSWEAIHLHTRPRPSSCFVGCPRSGRIFDFLCTPKSMLNLYPVSQLIADFRYFVRAGPDSMRQGRSRSMPPPNYRTCQTPFSDGFRYFSTLRKRRYSPQPAWMPSSSCDFSRWPSSTLALSFSSP